MATMNFVWEMTGNDWYRLHRDDEKVRNDENFQNYEFNTAGFYGCCKVGNLCADIQHTLDPTDCYAFANVFSQDLKDGYGETKSGIKYGLLDDSPSIPFSAKNPNEFKKEFEKNFKEYIKKYNLYKSAYKPLANWD